MDTVIASTDDLDKCKYKSYVAPREDIQEQQVLTPISGHKNSEPLKLGTTFQGPVFLVKNAGITHFFNNLLIDILSV